MAEAAPPPTPQWQALIAALPGPALIVEADRRLVAANPAAAELAGSGRGLPPPGQTVLSLIRHPRAVAAIDRALAGETFCRATWQPAGSTRTWQITATALEPGRPSAALLTFADITPTLQADEIRSDFVANVSHELRSPLTALSGFIETLQGAAGADDSARAEFLALMAAEAGRMQRLIDDLLSLSRLEADAAIRPTEPVDMAALVAGVLRNLQGQADRQGAELALHLPDTPLAPVPGDPDQLTQLVTNLVENAIRHGGGRVEVTLDRRESDPGLPGHGGGVLRLSVADQGPGIDPVHIPRLTERFYRVDSHRSRRMGGTGLGLAIVKHVVARHRGRLQIDSRPGAGSRFSVLLPEGD